MTRNKASFTYARSSSVLDAKVLQLYLHLHHERITGMRRKKGHERAVGCHYFNCFLITEQVSPLEATQHTKNWAHWTVICINQI